MKFCNQCKKEINTNANFCAMCGTQLTEKKKKDIINILSIISLILFVVIILANVIGYPLSVTDDISTTGMGWFFLVFLPSIPLFFISTILSIVSIISYFRNIFKKNQIQPKKTILAVLNIIQIILTVLGIILAVNSMYKDSLPTEEGLDYSIETINEMFIVTDDKYSTNEIDISNVRKFNQLLSYVDSIIGKDKYYLGSLYTTEIPHDDYTHYVIKIIPKEYIEEYNSWTGNFSSNPYLIMFTMETDPEISYEWHEGMYDNYYQTFILGMKYKEDLEKEFSSIDSKYKYLVDYNTLLYISATNLGIESNSTWQDGLNVFSSKSKSNLPSMLIIAPYGTTEEEGQKFIEDNKEIFEKYYVRGVTLCVLKENETITDYNDVSKYDDVFETYYSYRID